MEQRVARGDLFRLLRGVQSIKETKEGMKAGGGERRVRTVRVRGRTDDKGCGNQLDKPTGRLPGLNVRTSNMQGPGPFPGFSIQFTTQSLDPKPAGALTGCAVSASTQCFVTHLTLILPHTWGKTKHGQGRTPSVTEFPMALCPSIPNLPNKKLWFTNNLSVFHHVHCLQHPWVIYSLLLLCTMVVLPHNS